MKAGKLTAVIGASRSGKTAFVQHELTRHGRVLVWDVKGEYPGADFRPRTPADLTACIRGLRGKPGRIVYQAGKLSDFDFFCRAAAAWIKGNYLDRAHCAVVFEETADVTTPAKAPEAYGILLRRYLAYGVDLYAVTQRPAESDKTSIGNASRVHICRVGLDRDRKSAAANTGVPLDAIQALEADQDAGRFDFIHADTGRGYWQRGALTWLANGRPQFKRDSKRHKI